MGGDLQLKHTSSDKYRVCMLHPDMLNCQGCIHFVINYISKKYFHILNLM